MENRDLIEYFNESLFLSEVKAKTKEEVFQEFSDLFVKTKYVRNKQIVVELLTKRETLGSTGIGKGVAIPHGRTTAALDVLIAFGKSGMGIDFQAIDKKPVHLIFVVLAPPQDENNRYLPVLGKLVELLSDKKFRKKLMDVQTYDEFLQAFGE